MFTQRYFRSNARYKCRFSIGQSKVRMNTPFLYLRASTNSNRVLAFLCIILYRCMCRRCATKPGISKLEFYSDEKREWMREYSALGSKVRTCIQWLSYFSLLSLATSSRSNYFWRDFFNFPSKRWAITLFVLADGKVQKLVRELDPYFAEDIVINAIKSLEIW